MSDEFELIDAMVAVLGDATGGANVIVGPGDDAAVLALPPTHQLVVSTDTLISGRHFPAGAKADLIGFRSMAVATSDLAAMGAEPGWATVSLTAPELSEDWALKFAAGVAHAARRFDLKVVGGNLARGPTSVTVTVHGHVPPGQAMTRDGAKPEDGVYVTGALGAARRALANADQLGDCDLWNLDPCSPEGRYWMPRPRLTLGARLRAVATAAVDISDGLAADLAHLCRASRVSCHADLERLPTAPDCDALEAASAGDDYELAFTAPPAHDRQIAALAQQTNVAISRIGTIVNRAPQRVTWRYRGDVVPVPSGYRHF